MNRRRFLRTRVLPTAIALLGLARIAVGDPRYRARTDTTAGSPSSTETRIGDARIQEGDSGLKQLVFTVHLSQPPGYQVAVDFSTADGTGAVADSDYDAVSGTLVFEPADTLGTISVATHGDQRLEANEWFLVRLSNPIGVALADSEAFGTILNDERATFTSQPLASTYYDGITTPWGDCNGDGDPDLPLFLGGPGVAFSEIPGFRTLLANGNYHGASWCDYDRDGDLDLVILGYYLGVWDRALASTQPPTPDLVLQNQGNGTFVNVAPALGMDVAGNSETTVWGDFDGDGWPDLFVPYYAHVYPYRSFLYHNNGDGTFIDIAQDAGVDLAGLPANLRPEGAASVDWNDDGYLDLFCASHFFINDGTGHFTDVRQAVGLPEMFDEGANFADYDNDGDFDFYIRGTDHPRLFRNDSGHFTDVTAQAGVGTAPLCWGDSWADVDNDGDLDLLQVNCNGPGRLMLNQGDGAFVRDLDFESVCPPGAISSWADADGDGDLDVVVNTNRLLVNHLDQVSGFSGSSLRIRVLDAEGHETTYGATVRLKQLGGGPGTTQTRVVDGGSGYLGQNEYTVQFGGVGSGAYALEVAYPSPLGTRIVVDWLLNPLLGDIEPAHAKGLRLAVYRDGRVEEQINNTAVPPVMSSARVRWLGAPFPTPVHRLVSFSIAVDSPAHVALAIHDLSGRLLRRLDQGLLPAGQHPVQWNLTDERGAPVSTGIYFCRLLLDGNPAEARRVIVAR